MRRPLLINGFLLGLALLLGWLTWLSIEDQHKDEQTYLTGLIPDQINQIEINNSGPSFRLQREAEGWIMVEPYQVAADSKRIERLLEISRSVSTSRFQAPQDLAEYGLKPPQAVLTLNQTRIEMGSTHPMNQRRYLRVGKQIHLIKDRFPHHLQARAENFVSPSLLPPGSRVMAIKTPQWQLTFAPSGKASLNPPIPDISNDALNGKRDEWRVALASKVMPITPGEDLGQIEIQLENEPQPINFGIGRSQTGTLLLRKDLGLAYLVSKDSKLLDPPAKREP